MSFPQFPKEYGGIKTPRGIVVTGAMPKCGKTVACAGVAGALSQLGFKVQAVKPLVFASKTALTRGQDVQFFNKVLPPLEAADPICADSAHQVSNVDWHRALDICQRRVYSYLLETPGSLASPVRYVQDELFDAIDLARTLQTPILLVTPKQVDAIAALTPALTYLWKRNVRPLGWLAVETEPTDAPYWDQEMMYLSSHFSVPYLGEIAYSPSISVEACQQGNLIRTTELGIDLLPIQQTLELMLP